MVSKTSSQSLTMEWKVHLPNLFSEILANPGTDILRQPLNILTQILKELASLCIEIDDPRLNILMLRLMLYEVSPQDVSKHIKEQKARLSQSLQNQTSLSSFISFFPGDKIKFQEESQQYTIRACDKRFLICTKPFNPKHTVIYTIVDLLNGIRGTENLVFGFGAETDEQCQEMLLRLQTNKSSISHRNQIPLKISGFKSK